MIRIGVNGFGRVGRLVTRLLFADKRDIELVALNARADSATLAHLLRHDSVHGAFAKKVSYTDQSLTVAGKEIKVFRAAEPAAIPWAEAGVDIVIEATGKFKDKKSALGHIRSGAKKVIVGAPGKGVDATLVYGVNHHLYDPQAHQVISTASCTTNCLAPMVKVLHDSFDIQKGLMTTIHSYTMSQRILDGSHKDLRRARAAAVSMIPTSTGAAQAVSQVLPELAGRLDGFAIRVPTPNVSLVDFTCSVARPATRDKVNLAFKRAARKLKGVLAYTEEPLVSIDYTTSTYSLIVDGPLTQVSGDDLIKVLAWYDNEAGFSARLIDVACYIGSR